MCVCACVKIESKPRFSSVKLESNPECVHNETKTYQSLLKQRPMFKGFIPCSKSSNQWRK